MREIRERITSLTTYYQKQLGLYEQIRTVGAKEQGLIKQGQLDQLLVVLQEKESLLREASVEENQIRETQMFLARHFGLEEFSIPQLKKLASNRYQKDFSALEQVVGDLVPVLENLEEQERSNESLLNDYLGQVKMPDQDQERAKRANRAYKSGKS